MYEWGRSVSTLPLFSQQRDLGVAAGLQLGHSTSRDSGSLIHILYVLHFCIFVFLHFCIFILNKIFFGNFHLNVYFLFCSNNLSEAESAIIRSVLGIEGTNPGGFADYWLLTFAVAGVITCGDNMRCNHTGSHSLGLVIAGLCDCHLPSVWSLSLITARAEASWSRNFCILSIGIILLLIIITKVRMKWIVIIIHCEDDEICSSMRRCMQSKAKSLPNPRSECNNVPIEWMKE